MKIRNAVLIVLAVALMLAANVRIVYSVSVDGTELDGTYSSAQLESSSATARELAAEISRGDAPCADYSAHTSLTLRAPSGSDLELCQAMLRASEGVDEAWSVRVDGTHVGLCSDPTAFGEVLEVMIAQRAFPACIAANFAQSITMDPVYTYEGKADDMSAVALAVRGMTEVVSVTADGRILYS